MTDFDADLRTWRPVLAVTSVVRLAKGGINTATSTLTFSMPWKGVLKYRRITRKVGLAFVVALEDARLRMLG